MVGARGATFALFPLPVQSVASYSLESAFNFEKLRAPSRRRRLPRVIYRVDDDVAPHKYYTPKLRLLMRSVNSTAPNHQSHPLPSPVNKRRQQTIN